MKHLSLFAIITLVLVCFLACATGGKTSVKNGSAARSTAAATNTAKASKAPSITYPLAIRMAEASIKRFVTTPEEMRDKSWEISKNKWDSVKLTKQRELPDGRIEYTLTFSVDQKTRIYTTDQLNILPGPKNTYPWSFGPISGPKEKLSAYNAQKLIDQCKIWYTTDPDYKKIIDIIEKEVVAKLTYDWEAYYGGFSRTYQESLQLGLGVCSVYADLVAQVLSGQGYKVEKWSSSIGNHAWNHVIMPNGKTLYIDATWYDNGYENHPTQKSPDNYCPWYITYNKSLFEHGYLGTINMHGGWQDSRKRN